MPKPFEKGDPRINRSGRKAGQSNRSVEQLRAAIHAFIDDNIETLQKDFDYLKPMERLNYVEKMLSHVLPKPIVSLNDLSESDLDILLEKLKNQSHDKQASEIKEN